MSNLITNWRVAVQNYLATVFTTADIVGGRDSTVNRETVPKITVFSPGWPVLPRNDTIANPTLIIRYFPSLSKQPSTSSPRDQAALEQATVDLLTAFAGKNRVGDFVADLSCRVASVTPHDTDAEWFVELLLQAHTLNIAMPAA